MKGGESISTRKAIASLAIASLLQLGAVGAAPGFETDGIVLYQPDPVLTARISGAKEFADYTTQLQKVCTEFFKGATSPETLHVVIALKPGNLSRIWFVSSSRKDNKGLEPLRKRLEAVPAMSVYLGPVAFAISAKIAGGDVLHTNDLATFQPPMPEEWKAAAKGLKSRASVPDGFLKAAWPDSPGDGTRTNSTAPPGFAIQVLEPTGGKVLRPKDWFYTESHGGDKYMWTISREDTSKGQGYDTGVRIQVFVDVKKRTGKTGEEVVLDFVAAKKTQAAKVDKTCAAEDHGLFTRVCLETEEGPHHILYSLFWGSHDLDMVVISIAGTPKDLWDTYSPSFDKMSPFEVIDMKRFSK